MIAVIADIHANRPALEAVLAEARRRGAARLLVLGDVVGYHAEPAACCEQIAAWPHDAVIGNHDLGALGQEDRYANRLAREVQAWTAERLGAAERALLGSWCRRIDAPSWSAVHGCFTHPESVVGYVTPSTALANLRALSANRLLGWFGHSHVPAIHAIDEDDRFGLVEGTYALPRSRAAIVNPGSVGQPRDGDPRASFALFDPEAWTMQIVRVAYDLDATIRALDAAHFAPEIARRLREAR